MLTLRGPVPAWEVPLLLGTLASVLIGCSSTPSPCATGTVAAGDGHCDQLGAPAFLGIESATWDGADGLEATWSAAAAQDGAVEYRLRVEGEAHEAEVATDALSATVEGLPGGEYVVWVEASVGNGETTHGDRAIRQLVGDNRLVYRSEVALARGAVAVDAVGHRVAFGGGDPEGVCVVIVDVTDVAAPATVATLSGLGDVSDVDLGPNPLGDGDASLLAVATDVALHPEATVAAWFYDLGDPGAPELLGTLSPGDDDAHTLALDGNDHLVVASTAHQRFAVYDLRDPSAPQLLGSWTPPPPALVHDQTWVGDRLYVAYAEGLAILDVADPSNPTLLGLSPASSPDPFVHNLAPTGDGRTLAVTEKVVGGGLRLFDVSDPLAITQVGSFVTDPSHTVHNVDVRENWAFAAWFVDGILALDLSDPANPVEVGRYDTWSGDEDPLPGDDGEPTPNVNGASNVAAWGAHLAVTDSARGLVLLDFFPPTIRWGDDWGSNPPTGW